MPKLGGSNVRALNDSLCNGGMINCVAIQLNERNFVLRAANNEILFCMLIRYISTVGYARCKRSSTYIRTYVRTTTTLQAGQGRLALLHSTGVQAKRKHTSIGQLPSPPPVPGRDLAHLTMDTSCLSQRRLRLDSM